VATLIVNGQERVVHSTLGTPLVNVLRDELGLVGTKIGCLEGDCGACAIIVGEKINDEIKYCALTSCLMPLGNAIGRSVITIEGTNLDNRLSRIQKAFVDHNGIQCGFCTPGFIISAISFALTSNEITLDNMINAVAGNICRCTGYKSIERALDEIVNDLKRIDMKNRINWLINNEYLPEKFLGYEKQLKTNSAKTSYHNNGKIIAGGTDLLVQEEEAIRDGSHPRFIWGDPSLKTIRIENAKCYIGGATTVSELYSSTILNNMIPRFKQYLRLVSSTLIRNMATVGGNIANGSPIGDLSIMFQALDATLFLRGAQGTREIAIKDFFTGYKKTAKQDDEIIEYIYFNTLRPNDNFSFEKISKRTHLDMATVNSCLKLSRNKQGIIEQASFSVGGLGPTIRFMSETSKALLGKVVSDETFIEAERVAQKEITPRSRPEYKRLLVRQQLFLHLKAANDSLSSEVLR